MQGDVMKESMTVAKSLAWSLFANGNDKGTNDKGTNDKGTNEKIANFQKQLEANKNQGIHIHVPEGATPKDGPSAGTAITMVLYSLFNAIPIKNDIAITGEICLQGRITAIGGLELKILGGIRAGVKTFIYPSENQKDFDDFVGKFGSKTKLDDINFIPVSKIEEVLPLLFD